MTLTHSALVATTTPLELWRLDAVSVLLLVLIVGIAAAVLPFAHRSMRGDSNGRLVMAALVAMLIATAGVSLAGSLWVLAIAWSVSTLATLAALAAGGGRRAIIRSAPWLLAADIALWSAVVLDLTTGTTEAPAIMLVIAAVIRCALPPAHSWLVDSLYAPTPVSAALHGGIVNGGGIVLLTQASLLGSSEVAVALLAVVAGVGVIVGTLAALVRTDVKGRLVMSTVAQMGFMLLCVALGLTAAALLHLVAHGFYKSSLFLASSDGIDRRAFDRRAPRATLLSPATRFLRVAMGITVPLAALISSAVVMYPGGRGFAELLLLVVLAAAFATVGARLALLMPTVMQAVASVMAVSAAALAYVSLTSLLTLNMGLSPTTGLGSSVALGAAGVTVLALVTIAIVRAVAPTSAVGLLLLSLGHRVGAPRTSSLHVATPRAARNSVADRTTTPSTTADDTMPSPVSELTGVQS